MSTAVTKRGDVNPSSGDAERVDCAALVRMAAGGDRDAVERQLMHAKEVAYRFSLLVCGHPRDAEDMMQKPLLVDTTDVFARSRFG